MWHVTGDTWHVTGTRDMWHLTLDRYGEVNLLSKCQLPSSYRLGMKVCWRYTELFPQSTLNDWINDGGVFRTALATPGLLNIHCICDHANTWGGRFSDHDQIPRKVIFQCAEPICLAPKSNFMFTPDSIHHMYWYFFDPPDPNFQLSL